jgi:formamidopyrimidine-DNA glycosylase
MPELPEVETVVRGLMPHLKGAKLARVTLKRSDLRFPLPASFSKRLAGATVTKIERRAKYLLFHFSNRLILLSHLGMSGRFRIESGKAVNDPGALYDTTPAKKLHDHVVLEFGQRKRLIYNDARRFGFMELFAAEQLETRFQHTGIEPLTRQFTGNALHMLLNGKKAPIKPALLDQGLIAGIGNIYACEALYEAKISPKKPAGKLNREQTKLLSIAIKKVLKKALKFGGSTLRDFHDAGGTAGRFQHEFGVYGRKGEPCLRCNATIKCFTQAGRSTFYCPSCQR